MKKIWLVSLALAGSIVAASAQDISKDSTTVSTSSSAAVQDDQIQIKSEELPIAVKKALESPEYKGWIINAAYKDKKHEKYVVELKNGADTKKLKFNTEGKVVKD
jgi:hypothetical protein